MAMLGPEKFQFVRREIHNQEPSTRLKDTTGFGNHAVWRGYIMKDLMDNHEISRGVFERYCRDISLADTNTAGVVIFGLIMGASHFGSRRCTRAIDTTRRPRSFPLPLT